MSMSTGDVRRPSSTKATKATAADDDGAEAKKAAPVAKKSTPAKAPAGKATPSKATGKLLDRPAAKSGSGSGAGKGGNRGGPAGKGGGRGRRPVTPVKVNQGANWGPIMMFGGAGLLALLIIGFAAFQVIKQANQGTWQERVAGIDGLQNYLVSNPEYFEFPDGNHKPGLLTYPTNPPAGGVHNDAWQNCMGDIYTSEIAKEHAVHSLEHGAVWVTYRPDLPQDQIDALADKVRDKQFVMMSPYPELDAPISLQAWGYQLKVDNAGDGRIDEFINSLRQNATVEPGAVCSRGITDATGVPLDLPASP